MDDVEYSLCFPCPLMASPLLSLPLGFGRVPFSLTFLSLCSVCTRASWRAFVPSYLTYLPMLTDGALQEKVTVGPTNKVNLPTHSAGIAASVAILNESDYLRQLAFRRSHGSG